METIARELNGLEELFSNISDESYSLSDLLEKPAYFFEIREKAGEIVNPTDYEKRVKVLLYQLPETIVGCIELTGIWTMGLKPTESSEWAEEIIGKRWYANRGLPEFEPKCKSKLEYLEDFQKKAIDFLPNQNKYTKGDVIDAFDKYYERIAIALKDSTIQEKHRVREEADRMRMYV